MSKRQKMLLLFIIILVVGLGLGSIIVPKFWLIFDYSIAAAELSTSECIKNLGDFNETHEINIMGCDKGYLEFNDMKICNYFPDYIKYGEDSQYHIRYVLYIDGRYQGGFSITVTEPLNKQFAESMVIESEIDGYAILKKYNINNDVDFIRFLAKNHDRKSTLFTSDEEIIENIYIKYFASGFGNTPKITPITGDYSGYITYSEAGERGTIRQFFIEKNNKAYQFFFEPGNYYDDEKINEVMNTIIIE